MIIDRGKGRISKQRKTMPQALSCQNLLRYKDLQKCVIFLLTVLSVYTWADYSPVSSADNNDNNEGTDFSQHLFKSQSMLNSIL